METPLDPSPAAVKFRTLLGGLRSQAAWRWAASVAARARRLEDVLAVAPPELRAACREAASLPEGSRVERPTAEVDEASAKKILRALDALARPPKDNGLKEAGVAIVGLVRRTAGPGRGGVLDVTVESEAGTFTLSGLPGSKVASFSTIRHLAIEEGHVLPLVKNAGAAWAELLAEAMVDAKVEAPAPEEDLADAIETAIRRTLLGAPHAGAVADLEIGAAIRTDTAVMVKPAALIRACRALLPDDQVGRRDVTHAARRLGLTTERPVFDGTRPRLWCFPAAVAEETKS